MSREALSVPAHAAHGQPSELALAVAAVDEARAQAQPDPARLTAALHRLAHASRDAGQQMQVLGVTEEALLLDDRHDPLHTLDLRLLRAQALSELSLDAEALQEAQAAFDNARQSRCYVPTVRALSTLGVLYARMDDFDQAHELLMQALSRARDMGDGAAVRSALNNLVGVLTMAVCQPPGHGQVPSPAMQGPLHVQAAALWSALEAEPDAYRRLTMGVTAAYGLACAGELEAGLLRLQALASSALDQGFEATLMKARGAMAHVHLLRAEHGPARALMLDCLAMAEQLGNASAQVSAHEDLARACLALGDGA
jgi:tetratricopeptide (TPR) repeat protein